MNLTVQDRARRYVEKMDAAVSGSDGHAATFSVACVLVHGFDLGESDAYHILANDFNPRCMPPWSERELRHKIQSAQGAAAKGGKGYLLKGGGGGGKPSSAPCRPADTAARQVPAVPKKQAIDEDLRGGLLSHEVLASQVDIMERSPIAVQNIKTPDAFLSALYPAGERLLVFTTPFSQGDFGHYSSGDYRHPGKSYRLGARPAVKAELVDALPTTGREGVWYLAQPVDGEWRANGETKDGERVMSRRSRPNVMAWRYMLLEADDVDPAEWLQTIVQLPLAIAAIYTSAGRSIHALVRVDAANHGHFYSLSQKVGPLISKLGGDAAAISGVRLTRLPKCKREGSKRKDGQYQRYDEPRWQQLFYLNPDPVVKPLALMPKLRNYNQ